MPAAPASAPGLPLAYATGGLPGCGGRIRTHPEDFQVEELPAYLPSGQGEHLYLWVEKRGLSTASVVQALQRRLRVPPQAIGWAGKKDAEALSRQWLSVHTPAEPDASTLAAPVSDVEASSFRVLTVSRHGNKLRPGHLRGNRFTITLRELTSPDSAEPVLAYLAQHGFPNYFGPQRMGRDLCNAYAGRALLSPDAPRRGSLERIRFALNAYQGALFNLLVAQRLEALGDLERLLPGDLAVLHRNGAAFAVSAEGLTAAQARAAAHELSASAPLFGHRTTPATGQPGTWEQCLLEREGLTPEAFRLGGKRLSPKGERRPVRAFPEQLTWRWLSGNDGLALALTFTLAPGTYATSLLRELMKTDALTALPPLTGASTPATEAP